MEPIFASFFMGGFECSTHLHRSGRRLDLVASTRHDELAEADYRRMIAIGMRTARDGVRWHLAEPSPGRYDFASVVPMVRAARAAGMQVVWDLLHFGWPDHVDPFDADFAARFAAFAARFAETLADEGDTQPFVVPVNEISFLAFAGGEAGFFNPWAHGRGDEIKRQFVRAALAAREAILAVAPRARFVFIDPVIHVLAHPDRPHEREAAAAHEAAQYHAWDMIAGRREPELGGSPEALDIVAVNYYVHNQWIYPGGHGSMIEPSHPEYRPLREMLHAVWSRYRRPVFIGETGIEDEARPLWIRYVGRETRAAMRAGAEIHGICLYPIVNHPGWDDDRHCHNGLWDYADASGHRGIYRPLALELERQATAFERLRTMPDEPEPVDELEALDAAAQEIAEATESSREG